MNYTNLCLTATKCLQVRRKVNLKLLLLRITTQTIHIFISPIQSNSIHNKEISKQTKEQLHTKYVFHR